MYETKLTFNKSTALRIYIQNYNNRKYNEIIINKFYDKVHRDDDYLVIRKQPDNTYASDMYVHR